ncbi:MAG: DUF6503 family protein [Acidobacteriota bacterium]
MWTLALIVSVVLGADAPIIDRAIAFHGGDLYSASIVDLELCSKSGCNQIRSVVDGDRYGHTVTATVSGKERRVRITNDLTQAWENDTPVDVQDFEVQDWRDWAMARVYFAFLPYRLRDPSVRVEDRGVVDWEGGRRHEVRVTFEAGSSTDASDVYRYWFDPKSGRLEAFAYSYDGNTNGLRYRRAINHRQVDGILFFDQINLGIEGEGLSVDDIDPTFIETKMREVSRITLDKIEVRPL